MYLWVAIGLFGVAVLYNAHTLYKNVSQLKTSINRLATRVGNILKEIKKLLL